MARKNFSKETLTRRFHFCEGRCEYVFLPGHPRAGERCNAKLVPGRWHGDHNNPDGLTGEPTFENCRCLCLPCHAIKTPKDQADIAKAKRRDAGHVGVPRPTSKLKGRPFPKSTKPRLFDKTALAPRQIFKDVM